MFYRVVLYYLSELTLKWKIFSSVIHYLVIKIELPILNFIFIKAGAIKVLPRHSVTVEGNFHPFLSDVDLSLIVDEKEIKNLMKIRSQVKFIFWNIGEIEYYNEKEAALIDLSNQGEGQKLWDKFYKIRKISWQKNKLNQLHDRYERLKIERCFKNILSELRHENFALDGSKIFKDYLLSLNDVESRPIQSGQYSPFLELPLYVGSKVDNALSFNTEGELLKITAFFPGSAWIPEDPREKEIKKVIIIKELLISLNNQRQLILKEMAQDKVLDDWIIELKERLKKF